MTYNTRIHKSLKIAMNYRRNIAVFAVCFLLYEAKHNNLDKITMVGIIITIVIIISNSSSSSSSSSCSGTIIITSSR